MVRDRRRIADLYLQGKVQADIADELELSQPTVSRDLKALQKQWLESTLVDFDEAKAEELAKVDRLEREYWTAWKRSCEDAETVKQRAVESGEKKSKEAVKIAKGQAGDPRFLAGIQWCIERRCRLLGLDAPEKKEITGELAIVDRLKRVVEMSEDEFTNFAGTLPDLGPHGTLEKIAEVEG